MMLNRLSLRRQVERRIGGLEKFYITSINSCAVERRIGGLESPHKKKQIEQ